MTGEITLERGVHLDLGGIAKGFAVDRVRDLVGEAGPCLVNAGGDIAIGEVPADGEWNVGVERGDGSTITIGLVRGGLATSGRDRRRWQTEAGEAHHIIDPATSRPTGTDLLRVTAFSSSAVDAEVLAKSLLIAGRDDAIREAGRAGIPCVLVDATGRDHPRGGARVKHDPTFWLLARSTGLLAYAFATATVVAGLTLKTRLLRSVRLASVTDVHRVLSLAGLVAVAAHATSLVLDETVKVTPLAVFVPGLVDYRTVWSAVGVVTLELMAIIHISFRLRRSHRGQDLAAAPLLHVSRLRRRDRARPAHRNRQRPDVGARHLRRRGRAGGVVDVLAHRQRQGRGGGSGRSGRPSARRRRRRIAARPPRSRSCRGRRPRRHPCGRASSPTWARGRPGRLPLVPRAR